MRAFLFQKCTFSSIAQDQQEQQQQRQERQQQESADIPPDRRVRRHRCGLSKNTA